MQIDQLKKLGIGEKEAKLYIALIKEGPSLANKLAKSTDILRTSVYDYLDVLSEKGFVTYSIKNGKKYFQAVEPEKILELFEERKRSEEIAIKEIIPELAKLRGLSDKKAKIEVFEGKEGMKTAMSRILKDKPKEFYVYGSSGVGYKLLPFYLEHWHKERARLKIKMKIIYNDNPESKERITKGPTMECTEVRFFPITGHSPSGTITYPGKVLITLWNLENPLAISIESDEISKGYIDYFEVLWKTAKN